MVFHFDRSGAQYTPPFDIHANPNAFIRTILAISSLDEEVLGFDTSVQWVIKNGRKFDGTIKLTDAKTGVELEYEMEHVDPESRRYTLRGRGTTCWRAKLASNARKRDTVIIKYSWRSEGRTPEYEHLEKAIGLDGVGQMITYGKRERATSEGRKEGDVIPTAGFHNRYLTCIVLEGYGASIVHFTSQTELLGAVYDAIAGENVCDFSRMSDC